MEYLSLSMVIFGVIIFYLHWRLNHLKRKIDQDWKSNYETHIKFEKRIDFLRDRMTFWNDWVINCRKVFEKFKKGGE